MIKYIKVDISFGFSWPVLCPDSLVELFVFADTVFNVGPGQLVEALLVI